MGIKITKEYDPYLKSVINRVVLEIPAGRCAWFKSSGGCTMCGFNHKASAKTRFTIKGRPWPNWLSTLYIRLLNTNMPNRPSVIAIFHGGSFFNNEEIPLQLQENIARFASNKQQVKRLIVESRCEYITEENLSRICSLLMNKKLEIGIGLESVSDSVRNGILNKGLNLLQYRKTIQTIHNKNAFIMTYIFFKPQGLTENQAIKDAISSIKYAFDVGSDSVSLSCALVQKDTDLYEQWLLKKYRPPWLWSIVEVLKKCNSIGPIRIGTFEDEPKPVDIPRNCGYCDETFNDVLKQYRETLDVDVFNFIKPSICSCFETWRVNN